MKHLSLILIILAALIAYLVTSSSQKTSGTVQGFPSLNIDFKPKNAAQILAAGEVKVSDLSLPQLISLDKGTVEIITKATIEDGEAMAVWAENLENEIAQRKVLKLVLSTWANITPRTTAMWTETLPAFDKYLDIYKAVAAAWAQNNPTFAINNWAMKLEKGNFKVPVLKTILTVWTTNEPENAGDWILFLNDAKLKNALYPDLIHTWFQQSPQDTFEWLVKFKGTNKADLDSLYLIKKWVVNDGNQSFEWLASEYSTPFIDDLRNAASQQLAETNIKLAKSFIVNDKMENMRLDLINSVVNESAGKNDKQALETISKIKDQKLKDSICYAAAMKLAGTKSSAIDYVKATGFLQFPDLNGFFRKWASKQGKKAVEWFTSEDSFIKDLFVRLIHQWNIKNNRDYQIDGELVNAVFEYIDKHEIKTKLPPVKGIPLQVRDKFKKLMLKWEADKKELFLLSVSEWAKSNYEDCLNYVMDMDESPYKFLFLKGVLPHTPFKFFTKAEKLCNSHKNLQYRQDLTAHLSLAIAKKSPKEALHLLRTARRLDAFYVYRIIDNSITKHSTELLNSLKKMVRKNLHIFMPYYFYHRSTKDPKGSYSEVKKLTKETFYKQSLRAVASGYADFHPTKAFGWQNSLSDEEKLIVGKLISSTVENP